MNILLSSANRKHAEVTMGSYLPAALFISAWRRLPATRKQAAVQHSLHLRDRYPAAHKQAEWQHRLRSRVIHKRLIIQIPATLKQAGRATHKHLIRTLAVICATHKRIMSSLMQQFSIL